MLGDIPHVIRTFETVEITSDKCETILHVVTDLPISVNLPGFNAENLHELTEALVAAFLAPGKVDRINVSYHPGAAHA